MTSSCNYAVTRWFYGEQVMKLYYLRPSLFGTCIKPPESGVVARTDHMTFESAQLHENAASSPDPFHHRGWCLGTRLGCALYRCTCASTSAYMSMSHSRWVGGIGQQQRKFKWEAIHQQGRGGGKRLTSPNPCTHTHVCQTMIFIAVAEERLF